MLQKVIILSLVVLQSIPILIASNPGPTFKTYLKFAMRHAAFWGKFFTCNLEHKLLSVFSTKETKFTSLFFRCVHTRPVSSLGHQGWQRVFWEGPKFFKPYPIVLTYAQHMHIFPRGAKNFAWGKRPLCAPLVTVLVHRFFTVKHFGIISVE